MGSVIPLNSKISAAKIWKMVGVQNFMTIPNLSMVWSLGVKFSTYGPNKVIIGVKMEIILITWRICMICIWIDCKFDAHSDSVHVKVIWGHLKGSKKVIWGRKSKTRPNAHDMHTIRLEIFLWIQWCASRGHPRSSYGVKKGHLGSKIENSA